MEHNATTLGRQAPQPGTRWNHDMMMGQNARRLGKQPLEPSSEPGNEDETECQKTRETIPGTLPETKRTEEMMMEQNARIPRTKKIMVEQNCLLEELRTPFSSRPS